MSSSHFARKYEPLISLEEEWETESSSEDESPKIYDSLRNSGPQFEEQINRLKADSTLKFRRKWEEILEKYSSIDDTTESDEIDLRTEKIIIDNGHLRSLASEDREIEGVKVHGNIWSGTYDFEKDVRDQKRIQKHQRKIKHILKEQLKEEQRFHNTSHVNTSDSEALEDNLLLISSSPTKKPRLSPVKSVLVGDSFLSPLKKVSFLDAPHMNSSQEDDDFLVVDIYDRSLVALFNCAFLHCNFYSESRQAYKTHLLSLHSGELSRIGYPVSGSPSEYHISELTILKLTLHFPLNVELLDPFRCTNKPCQRIFLSKEEAGAHSCSTRRQVFLCPILGCNFMTDEGYSELKEHIMGKHHSHKPTTKRCTQEVQDVSEIFSDSSLVFSDEEQKALSPKDRKLPLREYPALRDTLRERRALRDILRERPSLSYPVREESPTPRSRSSILFSNFSINLDQKTDFTLEENDGYSSIDELFHND